MSTYTEGPKRYTAFFPVYDADGKEVARIGTWTINVTDDATGEVVVVRTGSDANVLKKLSAEEQVAETSNTGKLNAVLAGK